jgi:hypothetical protein
MVEGGYSGGSTCAPIAAKIYQRLAAMEHGAAVDLAYLTPAIGHLLGNKPETVDLDAADDTPRAEAPTQPPAQRRPRAR